MIIYMWNRKETIIPEKQTARKPEKNLGFTSKFASPDRTMLITVRDPTNISKNSNIRYLSKTLFII